MHAFIQNQPHDVCADIKQHHNPSPGTNTKALKYTLYPSHYMPALNNIHKGIADLPEGACCDYTEEHSDNGLVTIYSSAPILVTIYSSAPILVTIYSSTLILVTIYSSALILVLWPTFSECLSRGGRVSRRIYFIARSGRLLKKGGSPSTISITIMPRDQMSTWRERGRGQ